MDNIIAFAVIGSGLKFIDEAFDEGIFNKKVAALIAPILTAIWITVSIFDAASATILLAILAGVLLSGKIDNKIFKISALLLILTIPLVRKLNFLWLPFIFLTIAGIIDEKGNDYVDKNKTNKLLEFFFLHRFSMKLSMLILVGVHYLNFTYFFAFLAFDIAYDAVGIISSWLRDASTKVFVCDVQLPEEEVIFVKSLKIVPIASITVNQAFFISV